MNFCPVCGAPLVSRSKYGKERPTCPHCSFIHFCDPKVAAVTLVEREGRVLLTRRAMEPARGCWTLPGGFVDCEEDPREAAVRECREETGLEIEVTGLFDLYYGKAHIDGAAIVIVYTGRMVGGQITASDDVDAAAFFSVEELPEMAFASSQDILARWKSGR